WIVAQMFTGIVEKKTTIKSVHTTAVGRRFSIDIEQLADGTVVGDSIAVNGVCLTVATLSGTVASFDVMSETLTSSSLAALNAGDVVNLERAMSANGRFGGHFVQGHVDGTGRISRVVSQGGQVLIYIEAPENMVRHMIKKGSVAIDGISLTIVDITGNIFYVSLIPTTMRDTNLQEKKPGDIVNLEADIVAKLINARLDSVLNGGGITEDKLRALGF
ncbi:MAG: riboflavin synthase, partial [Sedimentisphaerales bacterium]|nr:riboflavin synthase [Sedimentisphaerales bacterium]